MKMAALNTYTNKGVFECLSEKRGSERLIEEGGSKRLSWRRRLWMPKLKVSGYEHLTEEGGWFWTPKTMEGGSEHLNCGR